RLLRARVADGGDGVRNGELGVGDGNAELGGRKSEFEQRAMGGEERRWDSVIAIGVHKSGFSRANTNREFSLALLKIAERRQNWVVLSQRRESRRGEESKSPRGEGASEVTK